MLEVDKYTAMWNRPEYRRYSPGLECVETLLNFTGNQRGTLIDFGCGTGRASVELQKLGFDVIAVDFAENALDEGSPIPLRLADITRPLNITAKYGLCADVMEHIPTDIVDAVLYNISVAVDECLFKIESEADVLGKLIDQKLHMTVKPHTWWMIALAQYFDQLYIVKSEGSDLIVYAKANKE
jgi:ribosomal protein L11 methylase PrmA